MKHLNLTKKIGAFILLCVCTIGANATDYVFNSTNAKTCGIASKAASPWNFYFNATTGVAGNSATGNATFPISNSDSKTYGAGSSNYTTIGANTIKYSNGRTYTITVPEGVTIKSVTFSGYSNSSSVGSIGKIQNVDVSSQKMSFACQPEKTVAPLTYTYNLTSDIVGGSSANTLTFSSSGSELCLVVTLSTETKAATINPTITLSDGNSATSFTSTGTVNIAAAGADHIYYNISNTAMPDAPTLASTGTEYTAAFTISATSYISVIAVKNNAIVGTASAILYKGLAPLTITDGTYVQQTAGTYSQVTYKRTFTPKVWQTLCVPVAIPVDQWTATAASNIYELTSLTNGVLTITKITGTTVADRPYLIYINRSSLSSISFTYVNVTSTASADAGSQTITGISLIGNYGASTTVPDGSYFLSSDGKIYQASGTGVTLPAYRAYLKLDASGAKLSTISTDDTTTGIKVIDINERLNGDIYNLNGMKVGNAGDFSNMKCGVYIINGKKVILK
jgi:hypothetical protein